MSASSKSIEIYCNHCGVGVVERHKWCPNCTEKRELWFHCISSGWKGTYSHWYGRHKESCGVCGGEKTSEDQRDRESKKPKSDDAFLSTDTGKNLLIFSSLYGDDMSFM